VNIMHPILAGTLLAMATTLAQAMPILPEPESGSTSITSTGSTFTYALALPGVTSVTSEPLLLSLAFAVSQNAAAQNDTISLYADGKLLASGKASAFSVTNLDVSDFVNLATGTLTFQLFRGVSFGGGNIKLNSSTLTGTGTGARSVPGFASLAPEVEIRVVPEPGTLALFGFGLLGVAALRRRRKGLAATA
jgi:hypothetical protein